MVFAEPPGDKVEILFLRAPAFLEDALKVGAVLTDHGEFGHGFDGGAEQRERFLGGAGAERVEGVFALAAIGDEIDLPQQGELRGDAGLTHAEDFLKFGDGELLARNEGEQTQSGRIGESFEDVPRSVHAGIRWGVVMRNAILETSPECLTTDGHGWEAVRRRGPVARREGWRAYEPATRFRARWSRWAPRATLLKLRMSRRARRRELSAVGKAPLRGEAGRVAAMKNPPR